MGASCSAASMILTREGNCFVWGSNFEWKIRSRVIHVSRNSPQKLGLENILLIESGSFHTVALTIDGLYSWGCNTDGQLGYQGDRYTSLYLPHKVDLSHVSLLHHISYQSNVEDISQCF